MWLLKYHLEDEVDRMSVKCEILGDFSISLSLHIGFEIVDSLEISLSLSFPTIL